MQEKVAALVADAFQDSEFFLPKIAFEDRLGLDVEVVSAKREPIEIYSYFSRIGLLDVDKTILEADSRDYIGVLVPGGAKSPALLAEDPAVLAFLRDVNEQRKLVASIRRGSPAGVEVGNREGPSADRLPPREGVPGAGHPPDRRSVRRDLGRRRACCHRWQPRIVATPKRHRALRRRHPAVFQRSRHQVVGAR